MPYVSKYDCGDGYVHKNDLGKGDWQRIAYENLANAIIEKACKDYISYGEKGVNKHEVLRFFRSQWFHELSNVDPEYLITQLDKKARARRKEPIVYIEKPKELSVEEKIKKLKKEKIIIENHNTIMRNEEDTRIKRELGANAKKMLGLWKDY